MNDNGFDEGGMDGSDLDPRWLACDRVCGFGGRAQTMNEAKEISAKIKAALHVRHVFWVAHTVGSMVWDCSWPENGAISAAVLVALARKLGCSDVFVCAAGVEGEDCRLTFIK